MSTRSLRSYSAARPEDTTSFTPDEPSDGYVSVASREEDYSDDDSETGGPPIQHTFGSYSSDRTAGAREKMMQYSMKKKGFLLPPRGLSRPNSAAAVVTPAVTEPMAKPSPPPVQEEASPLQAKSGPIDAVNESHSQPHPFAMLNRYFKNVGTSLSSSAVAISPMLLLLYAIATTGLLVLSYSDIAMYVVWLTRGTVISFLEDILPSVAVPLIGFAVSCVLMPYLVIKIGGFKRVK